MRVLVRHYPGQGWVVATESGKTAGGTHAAYKTREEAVEASREHWPDHELEIVNEAIVSATDGTRLT